MDGEVLIESEKRRDGFDEGEPFRLADGQMWFLPVPMVRMRPNRGPDGKMSITALFTFGSSYDEKWRALVAARTGFEEKAALMDMVFDLLQRNYDLTDDQCSDLLTWDGRDEEAPEMLRALWAFVQGDAPKPNPGGTD